MYFSFVTVVPKHLNFSTISKDLFPVFYVAILFSILFTRQDIFLVFSALTSLLTSNAWRLFL